MGSRLAFPLAMPLGGVGVTAVHTIAFGRNQWLAQWTPNALPSSRSYMVAVDGKHYDTVINREWCIIRGERGARPLVEVVQLPSEYGDPGYFIPGYFSTIQANKIKLVITPPASVADVAYYRMYWDKGEGTVQYTESYRVRDKIWENGADNYEVWTDELSSGTYKFVSRTVDAAGNEDTNTTVETRVITVLPGIVTAVTVSYGPGTQKVTTTWSDPAGIGAGNVRVYDNNGSTANFYPDYETPQATVAAGVETWESPALADGVWVYGLRVYDGTNEEPNTSVLVSVRIESGAEVTGFPVKPILHAKIAPGGTITLRASVDSALGTATPSKVKVFTNDGAGGAVDYGTPLGGGFVTLVRTANQWAVEYTTGAYGETERIFGMIAYTAGGVASVQADEVAITPDATNPPAPLGLASSTGRN